MFTVGETLVVPPVAAAVTVPMPWSILALVAPIVVQISAEEALNPFNMGGVALKVMAGAALTVAVMVLTPPAPTAVSVYVVVETGVTVVDPLEVTKPIPGIILTLSAPVVFHVSVAGLPEFTVDGDALKAVITGGASRVTVAGAVTVPVGLDAVRV